MNHFIASDSPVDIQFLTLGTTIVVFVLFLLVASKYVWPHILKGLDQRDEKLRDDYRPRRKQGNEPMMLSKSTNKS